MRNKRNQNLALTDIWMCYVLLLCAVADSFLRNSTILEEKIFLLLSKYTIKVELFKRSSPSGFWRETAIGLLHVMLKPGS